jgi:hypothetical protein
MLFMHLHEVDNPLLVVVKHANQHCMEEVGLRKVPHNTWNISEHCESLVARLRLEFGLGWFGVGNIDHSLSVVIPAGVLLVSWDIIFKFGL